MPYIEFTGEVTLGGRVRKAGQFLDDALVNAKILDKIKAGKLKGATWKEGVMPEPEPTPEPGTTPVLPADVMAMIEQRLREEREKMMQDFMAANQATLPTASAPKAAQPSGEPSVLDGSVEDLRAYVKTVTDKQELQRLLEQEHAGKTRRGALQVIGERLDDLNAADA